MTKKEIKLISPKNIVHCKDCIHWITTGSVNYYHDTVAKKVREIPIHYCNRWGEGWDETVSDDYCSKGVRR